MRKVASLFPLLKMSCVTQQIFRHPQPLDFSVPHFHILLRDVMYACKCLCRCVHIGSTLLHKILMHFIYMCYESTIFHSILRIYVQMSAQSMPRLQYLAPPFLGVKL